MFLHTLSVTLLHASAYAAGYSYSPTTQFIVSENHPVEASYRQLYLPSKIEIKLGTADLKVIGTTEKMLSFKLKYFGEQVGTLKITYMGGETLRITLGGNSSYVLPGKAEIELFIPNNLLAHLDAQVEQGGITVQNFTPLKNKQERTIEAYIIKSGAIILHDLYAPGGITARTALGDIKVYKNEGPLSTYNTEGHLIALDNTGDFNARIYKGTPVIAGHDGGLRVAALTSNVDKIQIWKQNPKALPFNIWSGQMSEENTRGWCEAALIGGKLK